jgi:hypothetical protein
VFVTADDRRFAVWLGEEVVFPIFDDAALSHRDETLLVPAAAIPELAWLDERQG